ncbi:YdhR family protein [Roseococcus pinisoli]|uniref:YdhR family protein n=1 Tax=Roseococcus pinisoli TaxID=2835040 RepID=A0ABS5QIZ7_9PROT|nr:YdhR family protein [Roseococcus pinisoli]MBS7813660.1 YdhR family protein [Roseococcus pinisoli]
MPAILQVNYRPSAAQQQLPAAARHASAERINALPGFRWKIWIGSAENGLRGGIYLFDDAASAKSWSDQVSKALTEAGGTELTARIFEVNDELSALTHAPLGAVPVA